MNVKRDHSNASSRKAEGKNIIAFVGDVKKELKRVEWTSSEELRAYTKVVLASMFLLGLFVFFNDLIIQSCLNTIHFLVKVIVG